MEWTTRTGAQRSKSAEKCRTPAGAGSIDDDQDSQPVLVVRTGTDETSLWLPRARSNAQTLQVRVPDTIGEHQFNVLASDRQGGIALARATMAVRQALYVRAGTVPETLTVGDVATVTLVARNSGETPVELVSRLATHSGRSPRWTPRTRPLPRTDKPRRAH